MFDQLCILWTYVYSTTHKTTPFSYKSAGTGTHAAVSKENRLIILIAGSEAGIFPDALLIMQVQWTDG